MDFWAQHKDFILKILAGVGVFLVALIARSITYGDELENEQRTNRSLAQKIKATEVAPEAQIQAARDNAKRLHENANKITTQIGRSLADEEALKQTLLRQILRCTRTYAQQGEAEVSGAVEDYRSALREDLNGGFGQLRLMLRQEMVEEASQKNIKVEEQIGFGNVSQMEADELIQYLLQLELVARFVRSAIDAPVDKIEDIRITGSQGTRGPVVPIPGANPEFLQEYEVTVVFTAAQPAAIRILNQLEAEAPRVALRALKATRLKRPADHLSVEMTMLATAANPEVDFAEKKP